MKYKHDFAVKHLPNVVFGILGIFCGITLWSLVAYRLLNGLTVGGEIEVFMSALGLGCSGMGSAMVITGIEYTSTLNQEPIKKPRVAEGYKTIEQRREEVSAFDFEPHKKDIADMERAKKAQLTQELLSHDK